MDAATDQFYKTKTCIPYARGDCRKGDACTFAHGRHELRVTLNLRKTKLCEMWQNGSCNKDDCPFAHGTKDLRATGDFYKTGFCKFWKKGLPCEAGTSCRHAHGAQELRSRKNLIGGGGGGGGGVGGGSLELSVGSLELSIGAEGIADESLRTEGSIGGGPSTAISQSIPQSVAAPNKSSIAPTQVETSDLVVNLPSNTSLPEGEVPQDGCSGSIVDTGTTTTTTTAVIGQPLSNTPVSNTPPPPLTKKNPDKTASTTYLDEELREASDEEVLSSPVDQHNFAADMSPRTPPSTLLTTVVEGDEVSRQDLAAVAAGAALRSMFGGTQPLDNNTLINSARRPWYVSTESILSLAQEDEYYQPCSTATASTAPKRMMRPSPSSSGLLTRNDLSSASLLGNWRKLPSVPSNNVLNNQPTAASAEDWLHHVPSAPSLLQQQAMAGSNNSLATLEQLLNAENGGENDNKGGSTVLNIDTTDAVNAITVCIDGKVTKAQIRFGDTPLTLPTLIEAARLTNNNNNRETSSVLVQLLGGSSNAPTEYTLLDQLMAALRPEAAKLNNRLRRGHSKFGGSVPNLVGLLTAAANNRTEDNNLIRPK